MANPTVLAGVVSDATILSNQRVIDMNPVIQQLEDDVAPLTVMLMKLKSRPARSQKVEWLEDQLVPRLTTLAGSAVAAGDTVFTLAAGTGQFFRVRDVARIATSGENVAITAVTVDCIGVSRAIGAVTANTAAAGVDFIKLSNAAAEGATIGTLVQTKKVAQSNFCQIQRDPFGFTNTALASEMYGGPLDTNEKAKKFIEHRRQIENTLFFGQRKLDVSGTQPIGYAGGLIDYISTNVTNVASNTLTQTAFESFLRSGFRYGSRNKVFFCSPLIRSALSSYPLGKLAPPDPASVNLWGTSVVSYLAGAGYGKVDIVEKRDWQDFSISTNQAKSPAGMGFLVDMENITWRPLRDTAYLMNRQAPDEDSQKHEYLTEGAAEINLEPTHALLQGVTAYS